MSQHQGFRAFFHESSASETLKSAIAAHTILEETFQKRHICCQFESTSSTRIPLRYTLHCVYEAPFSMKSCEKSSQSRKKRVLIPKWAKQAARSCFCPHPVQCFSVFLHRNNCDNGDFLLFCHHFPVIYVFYGILHTCTLRSIKAFLEISATRNVWAVASRVIVQWKNGACLMKDSDGSVRVSREQAFLPPVWARFAKPAHARGWEQLLLSSIFLFCCLALSLSVFLASSWERC